MDQVFRRSSVVDQKIVEHNARISELIKDRRMSEVQTSRWNGMSEFPAGLYEETVGVEAKVVF